MSKINVLPKHIAELIAAGEVVERPASVIKELVENSIDAGANSITVEIRRGGILYMSVKDNGCGIAREDVPTAFMRHATSKIKTGSDLESIITLGFRGEALAAISSVSRTEIITCTAEETVGTRCVVEGGTQTVLEDVGCNVGTIIAVRDLFYNTPARMKFLKKDVTEGNAVAAVMDRIALSHPEIAFRLIRDGKQTLATPGDGNIRNTVYSVLGREFVASLIPVNTETEGILVTGMVCKPVFCKQNRNGQFFFLNGRLIRSGTTAAALEQAYKNSVMTGKFPCCVLSLTVPPNTVDVNVHPTKMEVRFSDEKKVFSAVYYAVKNALVAGDTRPELKTKPTFNPFTPSKAPVYTQTSIKPQLKNPEKEPERLKGSTFNLVGNNYTVPKAPEQKITEKQKDSSNGAQRATDFEISQPVATKPNPPVTVAENKVLQQAQEQNEESEIRYIGEAFTTYIIAEKGEELYLIDKHAAHERIIFEQLKSNTQTQIQQLLVPLTLSLTKEEYSVLTDSVSMLEESGFLVEDFGGSSVVVRGIPSVLAREDVPLLISEIAEQLSKMGMVVTHKTDDILHTVACKAAIKAGGHQTSYELEKLAKRILSQKDILYCPHGRPVAYKITKKELERQFGRIQ